MRWRLNSRRTTYFYSSEDATKRVQALYDSLHDTPMIGWKPIKESYCMRRRLIFASLSSLVRRTSRTSLKDFVLDPKPEVDASSVSAKANVMY